MLCLYISFDCLNAQQDAFFAFHTPSIDYSNPQSQQSFSKTKTPTYYRHHKRLPVTHTGIVIQLSTAELPLQRNHPLFKQFGTVHFDLLKEGGYAYCILTNFKDLNKAKKYLKQMIVHRAPDAKVVKYQLGRRKQIKS
jgi:hypothetical protein